MIETLAGAVVMCLACLCFVVWRQETVIEHLTETMRITLLSVTGGEEMELRRLAMVRRMQTPKTQYPTPAGGVTTELLDALKRRPGIRNTGDRQTLTMGPRDELDLTPDAHKPVVMANSGTKEGT